MINLQASGAYGAALPYPFLAFIIFLSDWKAAFADVLVRLTPDMNYPIGGGRVMVR